MGSFSSFSFEFYSKIANKLTTLQLLFISVIFLFSEWCTARNVTTPVEEMTLEALDSCLLKFYPEARRQDGQIYGKSALLSFRYAIERYLNSLPHNKGISLSRGVAFKNSNRMLVSILRKQRREGQEKVQHKELINPGDMKHLACPEVFSKDAPWPLLKGVWFYITYYFCRRGCEGLRDQRTDSFQVETDDIGHQYYVMNHEERTKNPQGGIENDENDEGKMYDHSLGFQLLQFYLTKVNNKCHAFFQYPARNFTPTMPVWYENRPLGKNKLKTMMRGISKSAGLSKVYTNHCVRATAITAMSKASVSNRHIMAISGHRSETSLQSYNSRPSTSQLRSCSDILTNYASGSESTSVNPMQPLMSVSAYPGSTVSNCGNIMESSSTFQRSFTGMFNGCSIGNLNVVINNN